MEETIVKTNCGICAPGICGMLIHVKDGKMTQALYELEAALEINPSNGSWHFNKGLTLDAINQFDDPIIEFELALPVNPKRPTLNLPHQAPF